MTSIGSAGYVPAPMSVVDFTLRAAGVNRISVGAQSFDASVLAKLGRRHGPEAAERAIRAAADVVGNVSVDLIHGARRSSASSTVSPRFILPRWWA